MRTFLSDSGKSYLQNLVLLLMVGAAGLGYWVTSYFINT